MTPPDLTFTLRGSGAYLPQQCVTSETLDARLGWAPGTVAQQFRLTERRWAGPDETSSFMGAAAAEAALRDAGWTADSLDVILGACGVMEQPIPGTAVLIQRRLGLGASGIPAYDINATCLSFLQALDVMLSGFALGRWRRGLIVSADIASAALDFSNPEASAIFGDGAAALALEAGGAHTRLAHLFQTFGDGAELCQLEAGGTRLRPQDGVEAFLARATFQMDGPGVFKATARRFPAFVRTLMNDASLTEADIDTIIPHQASAPALEHLKRSLKDGHAKTVDIFSRHGNQIATSLAHALHTAHQDKRLQAGTHSLLIGSSAGISLGGAVIKW